MNRTTRYTLAGAATLALVVGAYAHGEQASAGQPARNIPVSCVEHVNHEGNGSVGDCSRAPRWTVRPCRTEDSVNCRWDANTRGNRTGHSFVVREFPGSADMVCVMYVQHAYARHNDYCESTR